MSILHAIRLSLINIGKLLNVSDCAFLKSQYSIIELQKLDQFLSLGVLHREWSSHAFCRTFNRCPVLLLPVLWTVPLNKAIMVDVLMGTWQTEGTCSGRSINWSECLTVIRFTKLASKCTQGIFALRKNVFSQIVSLLVFSYTGVLVNN